MTPPCTISAQQLLERNAAMHEILVRALAGLEDVEHAAPQAHTAIGLVRVQLKEARERVAPPVQETSG